MAHFKELYSGELPLQLLNFRTIILLLGSDVVQIQQHTPTCLLYISFLNFHQSGH